MIWLLLSVALATQDAVDLSAPTGPDRAAPPRVLPPSPLALLAPTEHTLRPGLLVHHLRVPGMRKSHINVVFRRGGLEFFGRSNALFTAMGLAWDQATKDTSAKELATLQDLYEVEVFSSAGLQSAAVRCVAPVENLDVGLGALREVMLRPAFRRADLKRFEERWTRWYLTEAPTRSDSISSAALTHGWYPRGHAFAAGPDLAGWQKVTPSAVRQTHARLLREAPVDVMVVADLPWEELEPKLLAALDGVGVAGDLPQRPTFDRPEKTRVIGVHLGETPQASLSVRLAAPPFDHADAPEMYVVDWALGGGFLSRLNKNLREEKGLTYGIGSDYSATLGRGHWTVSTQVEVENLKLAIQEIEAEIAGVASEGVTQQELSDAVANRVAGWNDTLASVNSAASVYGSMLRHRRSPAEVRQRLDAIRAVDLPSAKRVSTQWMGKEQPRLWVVVGDQRKLEPQFEELGWEVKWLPSELTVLGVVHLGP